MLMKDAKNAFTVIELLVVIAIIGLLAGGLILVVQEGREKAEFTKTVSALKLVERGFQYSLIDEGRTEWWNMDEIPVNNPTLQDLLEIETGPLSTLSNYINDLPNFLTQSEYLYRSTPENNESCTVGTPTNRGVRITLAEIDRDLVDRLDEHFDADANSTDDKKCGKIRWQNTGNGLAIMIYVLSDDIEES